MNILVNASNLKTGGGVQVADSVCCRLGNYPEHRFVVVLSSAFAETRRRLDEAGCANVRVFTHDVRNSVPTVLLGRDTFLDRLVGEYEVHAVLTMFGPSRWNPRCPHLSGFAMPHLVLPDSPFFLRMNRWQRGRQRLRSAVLAYFFRRSSRHFYTENPYISAKVRKLFPGSEVYTVSNYYNQVYDRPGMWRERKLPAFEGTTLLTVTAAYPHKNLGISLDVARLLRRDHPDFRFRFVFTIGEGDFPQVPEELRAHFLFLGKVDITACPSLYAQCDIMFQPTLLECFTATYPEAMKMCRPIVTTDIEFARGLCGDAARYYSPLSADAAAGAVYEVAVNEGGIRERLVAEGLRRLAKFDNYEQRTDKLIGILERMANTGGKVDGSIVKSELP